jgi:hypothetical protein
MKNPLDFPVSKKASLLDTRAHLDMEFDRAPSALKGSYRVTKKGTRRREGDSLM